MNNKEWEVIRIRRVKRVLPPKPISVEEYEKRLLKSEN
jgi:hypothetical protein